MNNQQTQPGQGHPPVRSILEAARAVLTITRTEQNWSANEEDPRIGYGVVRERKFVLFTEL